ncbi:DUF6474 domain-containing protein [Tsukamurella strandjordii]|uniref:DUF6474 family protein n=1 Tax=Tsukamurella TaxID=2060 RepID=UPI001C7D0485|nr:DUF6474 family protein [Tsukamurella sp. TY48]GIZ97069.1 hypothetical protein TTY48_16810 [Tsukamurella sp. TY48]
MGLFGKKAKSSRAERKAQAKALKSKARLEAKLAAKNDARSAKRSAKNAVKSERGAQKSDVARAKVIARMQGKSDKLNLKIAETNARAAVDGKLLSEARLKRYVSTARLLAPVVVPLAYRAAQAGRNKLDSARATRLGVPVDEVAQFAGFGGGLAARVAASRRSLDQLASAHPDAETKAFVAAVAQRLDDLSAAITASEAMPPARRRPAHQAIARELDGIDADLLNRLGISS